MSIQEATTVFIVHQFSFCSQVKDTTSLGARQAECPRQTIAHFEVGLEDIWLNYDLGYFIFDREPIPDFGI